MITIALAARLSPARTGSVLERNFTALRGSPLFWVFLLSGLAEPLLYLAAIGLGVSRLIHTDIPYAGHMLSYPQFVAPAMLAVSAMAGAIAASTFGFFAKLRYSKIFEAIFVTPVRAFEIALAELLWAMVRGLMFSAAFLVILLALGLVSLAGLLAMLPATILVGLSFGAVGMGISTLLRGWQDFDMISTAQTALFLFCGTFAPITRYPPALKALVEITPLYHAVELTRGLSVGAYGPVLLVHAAYLLCMLAAGLVFSWWQMEKLFRR